jgi:hypothetical protein
MKTLKLFILLIATSAAIEVSAQNINWANLQTEERHIANVNTGLDYGVTIGIGYGYKLRGNLPVIVNADYSQAAGRNVFDDIKTRMGAQARLLQAGDFHFTARVQGVFRTYSTPLVRMADFGSDMSGVIGYYRKKWYAAAEFGFDKAIVTSFRHTDVYKEYYPDVKDGWYQPATGGNFYYGLLAGVSFGRADVYLNAGKVITQDFKTTPWVPFYGKVGVSYKFVR